MNGNTVDCKNVIKEKIISKYFPSSQVKDDSLADFQEKKTCVKGPKNLQNKPVKAKFKKRVKGQKDIRTVLKTNNKLVEYTKEFDCACKSLGVDVDPEQLQLAIALSKSLHDNEDTGTSKAKSEPGSSQKRDVKIRKTLQEYGFTVPDIKIAKRCKKFSRSSKLLLTSEFTKKQIISNNYKQVLLQYFNYSEHHNKYFLDHSDKKLYHLSTNITYNELKDVRFRVIESIEISHTIGHLLRDWSKIPGRPESPNNCRFRKMNFSEIDCSQDELDIVLSGSLKATKELITHKSQSCSNETRAQKVEGFHDIDAVCTKNPLKIRSCSPDLFDEEVSNISDNIEDKDKFYSELISSVHEDKDKSSNINDLALTSRKNGFIEKYNTTHSALEQLNGTASHNLYHQAIHTTTNDFMEITDCVGTKLVSHQLSIDLTNGCEEISGNCKEFLVRPGHITINKTRRDSNDLMEVTECVSNNKHYHSDDIATRIDLTQNNVETKIDLTQSSDENDSSIVIENVVEVDLSRELHSNSDTKLPSVQIREVCDDTIILNDEDIQNALHGSNDADKCVLSEACKEDPHTDYKNSVSIRINDVNKTNTDVIASQSFFDDYIHNHSDVEEKSSKENDLDKIDLTQSSSESDKISELIHKDSLGKKNDISVDYDDLYDDTYKNVTLDLNNTNITIEAYAENTPSGLSLKYTGQHSGVFEISEQELNYSINKSRQNICRNNFGGMPVVDKSCKADDACKDDDADKSGTSNTNISIEVFAENTPSDSSLKYASQHSGVFEISDQELNYSINKSRHSICQNNFGGISVVDNKYDADDRCKYDVEKCYKRNSDATLPLVDLKSKVNINENVVASDKSFPVTPKNNDYIIKTDEVTPLLDYNSMSTPELNKELDKYGLKPFKRKRAVQLLTYIYNQTHPIVESCSEYTSTPSKRRKLNPQSPKKILKAQNGITENETNAKDNCLYEVTKVLPDIKANECSEEDWIFQKREKAKIHSCRVPLHIAFQNYVSCRQRLREAILRYEPVNIDVIHKDLVSQGHRYDPKDLLRFLDKKCITVKTADNDGRNKKRKS